MGRNGAEKTRLWVTNSQVSVGMAMTIASHGEQIGESFLRTPPHSDMWSEEI